MGKAANFVRMASAFALAGACATCSAAEDPAGDPLPPLPCGSGSPESLLGCVETARYVEDLRFIAKQRPVGSPHWQAVQDRCAETLASAGFEVERHAYLTGVNVIGTLEGLTKPDELVVISAHYDHLEACDGADDNATGVAGVLESARVLARERYARTLVVACWDEEEIDGEDEGLGKVGSGAFVARTLDRGEKVVASFVYEMIGYKSEEPNSQVAFPGLEVLFPKAYAEVKAGEFRGDFVAVLIDDLTLAPAERVAAHAKTVGLRSLVVELTAKEKKSAIYEPARASDHSSFWDADLPALLLTDTGNLRNLNYHCAEGPDSIDRLDHGFATQIVQATVGAAADTLEVLQRLEPARPAAE